MATIINHPNSVWPNGLKVDSEGYEYFYPLGTNKVDITTITWPDGDKLVSPFVYQNDKLVGFVDTKAITVSGSATTTMNYSHIEADFSSIVEGTLTVNAPNATVKKFSWAAVQNDNGSYDYIIIDFNTTDQATIDTVRSAYRVVNKRMYAEDGSVIGTWDTSKLEVAGIYNEEAVLADGLFCDMDILAMEERGLILSDFDSDLSSLRDGSLMFYYCPNLTSFNGDLSSLTNGDSMFSSCELNAESIQHIADTINDLKSKGQTGKIHIGYADDVPSIILYESGEKLTNKGWTVYFNAVKWEQQEYGPYDVVKKNGYIPDASSWNDEIYIPNNLIITEITLKGEMINNE